MIISGTKNYIICQTLNYYLLQQMFLLKFIHIHLIFYPIKVLKFILNYIINYAANAKLDPSVFC